MFGKNHSVSTILKSQIPWMVLIKCSCHSIHLVASYACKALPEQLERVLRAIFAHFSRSSARRRMFAAYQEFLDVAMKIILRPGQTRWLSLSACVVRVLEQLGPLILYFTDEVEEDRMKSNEEILSYLLHPMTEPLLLFLKYALHCLTEFNTVFQGLMPLLHELKPRVHELLRVSLAISCT